LSLQESLHDSRKLGRRRAEGVLLANHALLGESSVAVSSGVRMRALEGGGAQNVDLSQRDFGPASANPSFVRAARFPAKARSINKRCATYPANLCPFLFGAEFSDFGKDLGEAVQQTVED
jgi:hypothetical protein